MVWFSLEIQCLCPCAWMGVALGSCTVLGEILVFLVSKTAGVSSSLAWGVPLAVHPILAVQTRLEFGAGWGAGPAPQLYLVIEGFTGAGGSKGHLARDNVAFCSYFLS